MAIKINKASLIEKLKKTDNEYILKQVEEILSQVEDPIAGYTIDGNPITQSSLKKSLKDAKTRISKGDYTTQDDVEKESEGW